MERTLSGGSGNGNEGLMQRYCDTAENEECGRMKGFQMAFRKVLVVKTESGRELMNKKS
jgi:hypothetical protein